VNRNTCNKRKPSRRLLSLLLCLILLSAVLPTMPAATAGDYGDLMVEQPALLVSGSGIIGNSIYNATNISNEKSYSLAELQAFGEGVIDERLYSANANGNNRRIYRGIGIDLEEILKLSNYTSGGSIKAISPGTSGMTTTFDLDIARYYYPNFIDDAFTQPIRAMLAWRSTRDPGTYPAASGVIPPIPPAFSETEKNIADSSCLQLLFGQETPEEIVTNNYNSGVNQILVGDAITEIALTAFGVSYTRAQLLMMARAEHTHILGTTITPLRGVPLAVLLDGVSDNAVIEFATVDGYAVAANGMTKAELVAANAILAYETLTSGNWAGYYRTTELNNGNGPGYLRLWVDGFPGAHATDTVSVRVETATESPYKHISYTDAPYNIDAITGATLTVEGPGVKRSVPITVRQIEGAADRYIHSGVYADLRDGVSAERKYEGVKVLSILDGLVDKNVEPLDDNVVVVFKNRWRQKVSSLSYGEIKNAVDPVILAYGTASSNETTMPPAPFVFNLASGIVPGLGNNDGPLKLVYNQGASPNTEFLSVAYMYVEEGIPPPGFKHIAATNEAYNNVANTEYILTFTGDELGKEVNYTVRELEEMAEVKTSLSHYDEYSLSNTTYWYVNEYEGIKLWDLLVDMGVDEAKADKGSSLDDNTPLVSFSSWDNYQISSKFSFYQLAHPELFYFYEKSPLDQGTNRPSKEDLAKPQYQPDNQDDNQDGTWIKDANNYPVKVGKDGNGYPVLLAYGVNSYPYVRNMDMDGYKSGLNNSGGPMRLIYGKTDGLNRANPDAEENYAYFFNNGSQQLQRVQEIYVGNGVRYSTHLENPNPAYQAMKDIEVLTVEIVAGDSSKTETYTLARLESILYEQNVTKSKRDEEGRQEKGYYYYRDAGGSKIEDLFEGINLEYLLFEDISLQGILGTVDMYSLNKLVTSYDLSGIGTTGYNSMRGTEGLGMMVAFAKNGYPLVAGSNNIDNTYPGYVHDDPTSNKANKAIRNGGGPLLFVRGQTDEEFAAERIEIGDENKTYVDNLTKIVVNLEPDPYAHVGSEYETLAEQQVSFTGAVAQTGGVSFTVGALESKQRYITDGEYNVGGNTGSYRGLDLYALLYDKGIGASALMNEITVTNAAGDSKTLTYEELNGSGKKVILAYGSGVGDDAKPLDLLSGGPMRLIIDGATEGDCIINVSRIDVSAASITAWKHNFGVYTQYADQKLEISGQNLVHNKTYTVAELEAMDNIIVQDSYKISNTVVVQGVELYKLLQNIGFAQGLDSSEVSAYGVDGHSTSLSPINLKDGINGKPIIISFGQGTTASNGLPLVPEASSPGYDTTADNQSGPLRLMVHDNSGWTVKYLTRIVVGQAGGNPDPSLLTDFVINGLAGGVKGYTINEIKSLPDGKGTKTETYSYVSSGNTITDTVMGAYLYDLLIANGVSAKATVTINTTDAFENTANGANYCNITMPEISAMKYFVAYEVNGNPVSDVRNEITATVRVYRNYDDPPTRMNRMTDTKGVTVTDYSFNIHPGGVDGMPQASIRAVVTDNVGGIWAGSNGAGAAYISPSGAITSYTVAADALKTNFVTGLDIAPDGSVWLSQGGSVGSINAPPSAHYGFANYKNGQFTFYDGSSLNSNLPNDCVYGIDVDKDGNVWVTTHYTLLNGGMEGGLTKFSPGTNQWRTWKMADDIPTVSAWAVKADDKGGAWVTTYRTSSIELPWPNKSYAYVSSSGGVTPYAIPAGNDLTWSRSVSIDPWGGVYITRMSGAHDPENDGGWLDYIAPDGSVRSYKGDDLIPDLKAKAKLGFSPEVRTVFVDAGVDIWLSTNGLGVYRCAVSDGDISILENFSSETGCWPAGAFDDVWSIYVSPNGKACFGSNGGVVWAEVEIGELPPPPTPPAHPSASYVGDATKETAQIRITGAVEKPGYFTTEGLKTYPGVIARTKDYSWQNSVGSTDKDTMTGVYLEDIFDRVVQLSGNAESITVSDQYGYSATLNLDDNDLGVHWTDSSGNKIMLAWRGTNSREDRSIVDFELPRLIVGQVSSGHVNRPLWVSNVVSIVVNATKQPTANVIINTDPTPLADAEDEWLENPFKDVSSSNWFYSNVRYVYERELMIGTTENEFSPYLATSRAMVVTILYRLAESPDISELSNPFTDVPADLWYTDAVIWAAANGIVNGYGNSKFGPDDSITREQMAVILYRYAKFMDYDIVMKVDTGVGSFEDADSISLYATEAMIWACNAGILQGSDNKLDPCGAAIRAQTAAVLERFITGTAQ